MKLITGDICGRYVLRSIDWTTRSVTFENLEASPLDFKARYFVSALELDAPNLPINVEYFARYLQALLDFAKTHATGKARVSKQCVKRLEAQLAALQK